MGIKLGNLANYFVKLRPIKSHCPLITWPTKSRDSGKIISPLSKILWPLNLAGWWLQGGGSERKRQSRHRLLVPFEPWISGMRYLVKGNLMDTLWLSKDFVLFTFQQIDGQALLLLSQADLVHHLKIKLGPALKIYNEISKLWQLEIYEFEKLCWRNVE